MKKLSALIEVVSGRSVQVIDALRQKVGLLEKDLDGGINQNVKIDTTKAAANVEKLRTTTNRLKKDTETGIVSPNATTGLANLARNLGLTVAAAVAARKAFQLTVGATLEFGKAFLGVTKNVDGTTEQLETIRDGILDLSSASGQSAEQIAAIAEAVGRTGASADAILPLVETANQVAVAFEVSAEQAVAFLSAAQKSFDLDNAGALELADSINNLGKNFATSEAEILNFVQRVAPATAQLNISAQDTAALGAALLDLQIPTEVASTAVRGLTTRLGTIQSASPAAIASLELLGTTGQQLADSLDKDASGAIRNLLQQLSELSRQDRSEAIKNIFGEEAAKGVLALVGNLGNLDKAFIESNDRIRTAGGVVDEFNLKVNSSTGGLDRAGESIRNFGITISESFEKPLGDAGTAVADFFSNLTQSFRNSEESGRTFVDQIVNDTFNKIQGSYTALKKVVAEPLAPSVETSGLEALTQATNDFNAATERSLDTLSLRIISEDAKNLQAVTDALAANVRVQLEAADATAEVQAIYDLYFKQFQDNIITVQQLEIVTNILNESEKQLTITTAIATQKKQEEAAVARGLVEEKKRDAALDVSINQQAIANNEANQRRAEATAKREDAATARLKNRNQILTGAGAGLAAIVNGLQQSVATLSTKATARLQLISEEFRVLGSKARDALDPTAKLNDALSRLRFNRTLAPQASTFTKLLNTMAEAAQTVRVQFFQQELSAARLAEQLRSNSDATETYVNFIENARDGLDLLDDAQLTELNAEIDSARQKLDAMTNAAKDATAQLEGISEGLLNEIDSFSGNLEAIENRRFEQQRDNIQSLRDVQGADSQAAADAESLAQEAHQNRLSEIRERAAEQARSDQESADRQRQLDSDRQAALQQTADTAINASTEISLLINDRTLLEELRFRERLDG